LPVGPTHLGHPQRTVLPLRLHSGYRRSPGWSRGEESPHWIADVACPAPRPDPVPSPEAERRQPNRRARRDRAGRPRPRGAQRRPHRASWAADARAGLGGGAAAVARGRARALAAVARTRRERRRLLADRHDRELLRPGVDGPATGDAAGARALPRAAGQRRPVGAAPGASRARASETSRSTRSSALSSCRSSGRRGHAPVRPIIRRAVGGRGDPGGRRPGALGHGPRAPWLRPPRERHPGHPAMDG
jgi:hypothetical protein